MVKLISPEIQKFLLGLFFFQMLKELQMGVHCSALRQCHSLCPSLWYRKQVSAPVYTDIWSLCT